MAAGRATLLKVDQSAEGLETWQLLKTQSIAQTAVTAAILIRPAVTLSFAQDTVDIIDVSIFGKIAIELYGVASDAGVDVLTLYGWSRSGHGHHIGSLSCTYSTATMSGDLLIATHPSMADGFVSGTTYRTCDAYVATDYEAALTVYTGLANFPGHAVVDFTNSQYSYFAALVTTLSGTTAGAIFKPLSVKYGGSNPQFIS